MKYKIVLFLALSVVSIATSQELAQVEGTMQIGYYDLTTPNPDAGTMQWIGSDLVGYNGAKWVSLTTGVAYDGYVGDENGNTYFTIKIGTQEWMAENLRTTLYNDGATIDHITPPNSWGKTNIMNQGAYCWYDNDESNKVVYGGLYNWYAVNSGKLCPTGWRVPDLGDWNTLTSFLGGNNEAGGKLKAEFEIHWNAPNNHATNEVGFTAQPGGARTLSGAYIYDLINIVGTWWSSSPSSSDPLTKAEYAAVSFFFQFLEQDDTDKRDGLSVRCIKN